MLKISHFGQYTVWSFICQEFASSWHLYKIFVLYSYAFKTVTQLFFTVELKHRLNYSTKVTEPVMLRFAPRGRDPESVPDRLFCLFHGFTWEALLWCSFSPSAWPSCLCMSLCCSTLWGPWRLLSPPHPKHLHTSRPLEVCWMTGWRQWGVVGVSHVDC